VILAILLIAAAAYLLGSIPIGYLLVRFFRKQDIRSVGSGNIGATNVLRSGGKGLGAATFLLDVLKGCAAVYLGGLLGQLLVSHTLGIGPLRNFQALGALCAVLGHMFPVWLRFLVILISRYVSLGSILGAASFPLFAWFTVQGDRPLFYIAVQFAVAILIIAKHHENIRRLLTGSESRFGSSSRKTGAA